MNPRGRPIIGLGVIILLANLLIGCTNVTNSEGPNAPDKEILKVLEAGQLASPAMYSLSDMSCQKGDGLMEIRATLTNTSEISWLFAPNYVFNKIDGTRLVAQGALDFLEPGESAELYRASINPDDYGDPPDCEILIYDDVVMARYPELYAQRVAG